MTSQAVTVNTVPGLLDAVSGMRAPEGISVQGRLEGVPGFTLPPGATLVGVGEGATLVFEGGGDGVRLTRDNQVADLRLETAPAARAVHNDTSVDALGTLELRRVSTVGRVELLARDRVGSGHIRIDDLDIEAADARECLPRPQGYNVEVLQGAFTLYNQQPDSGVLITCQLSDIAVGRDGAPVRGGGVFVSGTPGGGRVEGERLHTGPVFSDGGIPAGTPGRISGGVFVVYAAIREVVNGGPVTTYGVNDMVLDLWGEVESWTAHAPITSHGPSGIGFVNFGTIRRLTVAAPIETFGLGARGFNIYDGTVDRAEFDRIVTHADAAVGIQISKPFGSLTVHRGIETHGAEGESLVKGELMRLAATALSLKPGSHALRIRIDGGITTHGPGVPAVEILGSVDELDINGPIRAQGGAAG
ncbi:hypothetical protein [Streptomyces katsurahamanus]|uniref:Uncharacterized protein n=1 Tax=Streptomyces katsurahamanus TaxID=2577098 RepID=A0ABW9NTU4_9ACTN|nr:hypothetical protein [Streptomyces katsurahamanus]MQS36728.1 hypothetical protein [Streptomyces katsurahamanus]